MATQGNLKQIRLENILGQLGRKQFTGVLYLRHEQVFKELHWEEGIIIFSRSNDPHDFLGQYLLSHGYITEQDLTTALQTQAETKVLLGRILIMVGLVDEANMETILTLKAAEAIYSVFLWDNGQWELDPKKRPPDDIVRIHLDPESIIAEGRSRQEFWKDICTVIPSVESKFVVTGKPIPTDLKGDKMTKRYLDLIRQGKTVFGMTLEMHRPEFLVSFDLFNLHRKGLIALDGAGAQPRAAAAAAKQDIEQEALEAALKAAEANLLAGRYADAMAGYQRCLAAQPGQAEAMLGYTRAQQEYVRKIEPTVPVDSVPELALSMAELMKRNLTPEEGYLVSRINGVWNIKSIISVSPLEKSKAIIIFKRFLDEGFIRLK